MRASTQYESRIELPKGWSATPPAPIDLKESFAEFQGSSEVHEGVLITKRRLLLKASDVTPDQLKSYKAFQKALSDDHNTYIFLPRICGHFCNQSRCDCPHRGLPA